MVQAKVQFIFSQRLTFSTKAYQNTRGGKKNHDLWIRWHNMSDNLPKFDSKSRVIFVPLKWKY